MVFETDADELSYEDYPEKYGIEDVDEYLEPYDGL